MLPAEYPEFVLHRDHVHLVHVEEISPQAVIGEILLGHFEANLGRVVVAFGNIVHSHRPATGLPELRGDGLD